MSRYYLFFFLLLTGCHPEIDFVEGSSRSGAEELSLSGGTLFVNFSSSAGSASIDLEASRRWKATFVNDRAKDWCSLSSESGKRGKATIIVSVKENHDYDERSASIRFVCGDVERTIVVTQKQKDALLLTGDRQDVGKDGGRITVEVKSNIDFEFEISADAKSWIKPVDTKGLSSTALLFDVTANEELEKREGRITITSPLGSETVRIYQQGVTPVLIVSSNQIELTAKDTTFRVEVRSNVDVALDIPKTCGWLREISAKSMSTNTYSFEADENETFKSREAILTFRNAEQGLEETVTVVQTAATPLIVIDRAEYAFEPEGGVLTVELSSNMDLTATIKPGCDWLSPLNTKAVTKRIHLFSVAKNHSRHDRSAWIVFQNKAENQSDTILVSQSFQPILVPCDTLRASGRGWTVSFETVDSKTDDYRIVPAGSWLSLSEEQSLSDRSRFNVSVVAMDGNAKSRVSGILIYYKDFAAPDTVWVRQYAKLPVFSFTTMARKVKIPEMEEQNQFGFVFWGDNTQEPWKQGLSHTYKANGPHKVTVEIGNKKRVSIKDLENGMTINLRELRK